MWVFCFLKNIDIWVLKEKHHFSFENNSKQHLCQLQPSCYVVALCAVTENDLLFGV